MKVRWTEGSVRFRITPTELTALVQGRPVATRLFLPAGGGWTASLVPAGRTELRSDGAEVTVLLSADDVAALADGTREGVYFATPAPERLRYYVEKDFPCAHPHPPEAAEPESERFAPSDAFLRRRGQAPPVHEHLN
jgi:hypothetical protein